MTILPLDVLPLPAAARLPSAATAMLLSAPMPQSRVCRSTQVSVS
jgi:hypothetical protein